MKGDVFLQDGLVWKAQRYYILSLSQIFGDETPTQNLEKVKSKAKNVKGPKYALKDMVIQALCRREFHKISI